MQSAVSGDGALTGHPARRLLGGGGGPTAAVFAALTLSVIIIVTIFVPLIVWVMLTIQHRRHLRTCLAQGVVPANDLVPRRCEWRRRSSAAPVLRKLVFLQAGAAVPFASISCWAILVFGNYASHL